MFWHNDSKSLLENAIARGKMSLKEIPSQYKTDLEFYKKLIKLALQSPKKRDACYFMVEIPLVILKDQEFLLSLITLNSNIFKILAEARNFDYSNLLVKEEILIPFLKKEGIEKIKFVFLNDNLKNNTQLIEKLIIEFKTFEILHYVGHEIYQKHEGLLFKNLIENYGEKCAYTGLDILMRDTLYLKLFLQSYSVSRFFQIFTKDIYDLNYFHFELREIIKNLTFIEAHDDHLLQRIGTLNILKYCNDYFHSKTKRPIINIDLTILNSHPNILSLVNWLKKQKNLIDIINSELFINSNLLVILAHHLGDEENFIFNYVFKATQYSNITGILEDLHFHVFLLASSRLKTDFQWIVTKLMNANSSTEIEKNRSCILPLLKFILLSMEVSLFTLSTICSYSKHPLFIISYEQIPNLPSDALSAKNIGNLKGVFLTDNLITAGEDRKVPTNKIEIIYKNDKGFYSCTKTRLITSTEYSYDPAELKEKFNTLTLFSGEKFSLPEPAHLFKDNLPIECINNNPWALTYIPDVDLFRIPTTIIIQALKKEPLLLLTPHIFMRFIDNCIVRINTKSLFIKILSENWDSLLLKLKNTVMPWQSRFPSDMSTFKHYLKFLQNDITNDVIKNVIRELFDILEGLYFKKQMMAQNLDTFFYFSATPDTTSLLQKRDALQISEGLSEDPSKYAKVEDERSIMLDMQNDPTSNEVIVEEKAF